MESIAPLRGWGPSPTSAGQTVTEVLASLASRPPSPRAHAFPTGFDMLDSVLDGGVRAHDLVLIGGHPGVGKTIAALQWARNMAVRGATVVYACFEHDETALLSRLLMLELGGMGRPEDMTRTGALRAAGLALLNGTTSLASALASEPALRLAYERLTTYGDQLRLVRVSSARTGIEELVALVRAQTQGPAVLVVDYLQKVAAPAESLSETDRVLRIAEGLKELALTLDVAVVAVVAADDRGVGSGRLRLHHLRGASALSYEADVAVLLNEKTRAVAKAHLAYDGVRAASFKQQVVFTVEKNRGGPAPIDTEFTKDFAHFRFSERGAFVSERLVDERMDEDLV